MKTPCDYPIETINEYNGKTEIHYECPYADSYIGFESEMCRCMCGLGVDE